jgi:galactoside O-acetyltransferase
MTDLKMNYTRDELVSMLASVGENVAVHETVQFFSPKNIHLGSNVRIDCFAYLSAGTNGIWIADFVHLAVGASLFGASGRITIESFCGLSSRTSVYTGTDDYTEGFLTNPTVPPEYKKVRAGDVVFRKHSIVGAGSVIMPEVTLGVGSAVGALTLITRSLPDFAIAVGNPPRIIGERPRRLLELENQFLAAAAASRTE